MSSSSNLGSDPSNPTNKSAENPVGGTTEHDFDPNSMSNGQISSISSFSSIKDGVQDCIITSINSVLDQSTEYNASEVTTWVDSITSQCLENLRKLSEKFKYIVSVIVLQRSPAGFHLFTTCYWDQANDGSVTHRWDNKNLHCVVVVYGVAY
ncbi:Tctex-1 family protein [Cryptosporidium meleagridis]|uniref:Tctex-1 family protein n=1 Tax=Cryptosporidium meleagridis TaxID=93969 RepID=A0A2P4YXF5_9CRYT|nr:Tctex-1 family protein [Cryptosporidium meleagridis]